jgi:hypothetical protein
LKAADLKAEESRLRKDFWFHHLFRVRYAEVDAQSVVFNAHYLTYFDTAITEYFRTIGYDYYARYRELALTFTLYGRLSNTRRQSRVQPIRPLGDKVVRMSAQTARIEEGRVYLPESASWLEEFRSEVMAFPNGRHDDQVDFLAQALAWFAKPKRPTLVFG